MRRFSPLLIVVLVAALTAPAAALADGSLLSGYSRSGGSEQQVLGQTVLPAKHGTGSIRAPAKPVAQSAPAPATTPAPAAKPTPAKQPKPAPQHHAPAAVVVHHVAPVVPSASVTPPVALPAYSYPDAGASTNAGFPLSGSTLALMALIFLGLTATAVATRRASHSGG